MRIVLLTLLLIIGSSPTAGYAGTLVGDWFQEDTRGATEERRAFAQPISKNTEDIQVTLGIKSPGSVDPVDFYLVVSNTKANSDCQYNVTKIAIDSKTFSTTSTTHSSDIAQIATSSDDEQTRLWREFRKGQKLSLWINQTCSAEDVRDSAELPFDFSLKGSSAAYRFVAREAVTLSQENGKTQKPPSTSAPRDLETGTGNEVSESLNYVLVVALIAVVMIILFAKLKAKPGYKVSTLGPKRKEPTPSSRDHSTARTDSVKDSRGFHIDREPDRAPVHGYDLETSNFPRYRVEHVIDGDTVIVSSRKNKLTIRLDSIDCPEDGQDWGNNATAGLIKLIGGKHVNVEIHTTDQYDRMVATLYVFDEKDSEWVNVNEKMVVRGHAWVMRKYYNHLPELRKDKLNKLERWARSKKVGLWQLPNPVPPWNWRRGDSQ